jgi:hypothetical protein
MNAWASSPWGAWAERGAAAVLLLLLSLREELACGAWPFSRGCDERLLAVLWLQRLMLAAPRPSAALERRRAAGGGVARGLGVLRAAVGGWAALSGFSVTTDDETDGLREEVRRCEVRGASWWFGGGPAGTPCCMFMLAWAMYQN